MSEVNREFEVIYHNEGNEGETETPPTGAYVNVHYVGTLLSNGKKFDSSWDRGRPLGFNVGMGRVIKGWDEGIM